MTTSLTSHSSQTAARGIFRRLGATVAGAYVALDRERRVRITLGHLHRLSDHSLRDIGLARDEIEHVIRDQSTRW